LPPWEEIYVSDEARYENYEQAKLIQNHLIETYKGYEYDLIEVPKDIDNNSVYLRQNFELKRYSIYSDKCEF
jgi:predicted ATPase